MTAHLAAPIVGIIGHTRQQLAGLRRLDDGDGTVGPRLCALRIKRQQQVKTLAGIGIQCREQCRVLGDVEVSLVNPNLRGIPRPDFLKSIALDCAPALGTECLVLPQARVADTGEIGPIRDDAVGVSAKQSAGGLEAERLDCAANLNPAWIKRCRVTSSKKCPRAKISRVRTGNIASTIQSNCTRRRHSEPIVLAPRYCRVLTSGHSASSISSLIATLSGDVETLVRLKSSIKAYSFRTDHCVLFALLVTPPPPTSRAAIASLIRLKACNRKSTICSRDQSCIGSVQSTSSSRVPNRSGRIVRSLQRPTAQANEPRRSISRPSAVACSARVLIQAKIIAATIHPHSVSLSFPIGVPGGIAPSNLTMSRVALMAAAVACRCQMSSIAEIEGSESAELAHDAHAGFLMGTTAASPLGGACGRGACSTLCQPALSGVITASRQFLSG